MKHNRLLKTAIGQLKLGEEKKPMIDYNQKIDGNTFITESKTGIPQTI